MQTQDSINEKQLQITYYKNMEFFKSLNPKLFNALSKAPTLYNLHIDSYGYNVIHIPTQTMQYPLIENNAASKDAPTHKTSMQDTHKELAKNPMKNPQWELFSNHTLTPNAHFINEEKLTITGKLCNDLLRESVKMGVESKSCHIERSKTSQSLESTPLESNANFQLHCNEKQDSILESEICHIERSEISSKTLKQNLDSIKMHPKPCTHPDLVENLESKTTTCHTKPLDEVSNIESNKDISCLHTRTSEDFTHTCKNNNTQNLNLTKDSKNTQQDSIQTQSNLTLYENLIESFCDSKFLPQTNIYGLMGGMFLQELLEKDYQFYSLMIYEEHIDLFRISLYFIDYDKLFKHVGKQSCFIIIKDISFELVSAFLHAKKLTNNFLSLSLTHYTTDNVALLKDFIYKEKKAIMRGWGSFEDELIGLKNACLNLADSKLLSMRPMRVNAPICVIGNGASLDLCIDFLKAYKDSMILLSCGTALKVLRHHGITPDFQIEIERVPYLAEILQEANLGNIPLIFAQTTDTKACELASEKYGFLRGGSSSAYLDSTYIPLEFSAPFVGNAGVSIASLLGSDVILCGIDCGYIQGYSKHAKHSFYGKEDTEIPKDCFQVESNKNLRVFSNDLFYLSAKNIEQAIKLYKPNSVINLGYGMRFQHTIALNEDDFTLKPIDKEKELKHFKENFTPYKLILNTKEMLDSLTAFSNALQEILTQDTHTIQDIFNLTQDIFNLLQKSIDNKIMRKSIILLEGSIMHLSYTHLLAQLFAGTTTSLESKILDSGKLGHISSNTHSFDSNAIDCNLANLNLSALKSLDSNQSDPKRYTENTHLIKLKTLYSQGLFSLISSGKKAMESTS
ncbi:motility associated factor glycosyltransferase family protein [Helicobacter bilis]|uniref:motility associated factor glycosyltransferase family protein n=1 Tax=Helicobacter bilis TaxID=37372 RepID=UPI0009B8F821|nr:6-hydroxymethylpterin diphosphokinase MptE-like protein [Helicobacter bilis]TLE09218.1 DUF115 domain-containing protein [Helicobacter bilis]